MAANIFNIINIFRNNYPVDVEGLARILGINVVYAELGKEISGMIQREEDGSFTITVNENDPKTRKRFTIAHELGHFIYHKDKIGNGIYDNRMYRSVPGHSNPLINAQQETQANQFAASLLTPSALIERLQSEGVTDPDELAEKLGVSKQAMRIRLGLA
jgi:Zn-dependent peptidase ImmA (M78 family)